MSHLDRAYCSLLPLTQERDFEGAFVDQGSQMLTAQRQRNDTPSPFPVTPNGFRLAGQAQSRAGLFDLRFHDLRHEAISRFLSLAKHPRGKRYPGHRTQGCSSDIHLRAESWSA